MLCLRTTVPIGLASLIGLAGLALPATAAPVSSYDPSHDSARATTTRHIAYTQWSGDLLAEGALHRAALDEGAVVALGQDGSHTWRSPWVGESFGLTELIASWSARTPRQSWITVQVRGRTASGTRSSWDLLARWTAGDAGLQRTTESGQADDLASVDVDTWQAGTPMTSWQVRVGLHPGRGDVSPRVTSVGAVASALPSTQSVTPSSPTRLARGVRLAVPRYSQMAHSGHYPRWGGGGQAWCSPTSTSMVLGYYDALPPPRAYSWIPDGHVDPWVDHAARMTYDYGYRGTGNWPFNTAYAASRTGHAFVTRLHSLRDAERFIAAGIPLVASISFGSGELDGAPISASNGHLVVIAGFTRAGNVVVNDPASRTRAGVRRTYQRGQFENAWLPASGGTVYVITDDAHPLPDPGKHASW